MEAVLFPQTADLLGFSHRHSAGTMTDSGSRNRNRNRNHVSGVVQRKMPGRCQGLEAILVGEQGKQQELQQPLVTTAGLQITSECYY